MISEVAKIIQSVRPRDVEDLAFGDRVSKDFGQVGQSICVVRMLASAFLSLPPLVVQEMFFPSVY